MPTKVFFAFDFPKDLYRAEFVARSHSLTISDIVIVPEGTLKETYAEFGASGKDDWIASQVTEADVTVVLEGENTSGSELVRTAIDESIKAGKGLLGIDVTNVPAPDGHVSGTLCRALPEKFPFYSWNTENGFTNLPDWIKEAEFDAGRYYADV